MIQPPKGHIIYTQKDYMNKLPTAQEIIDCLINGDQCDNSLRGIITVEQLEKMQEDVVSGV